MPSLFVELRDVTTLRKVNTSLNRQQLVAYLLSHDILRVKRANKQVKTENVLYNIAVRRQEIRKPFQFNALHDMYINKFEFFNYEVGFRGFKIQLHKAILPSSTS